MSEFIEFEVTDPERFRALQRVFAELVKDKNSNAFREPDDWLSVLDDAAKAHFTYASPEARLEGSERPILITPTSESTGHRWDFYSMIESFEDGEYELGSCELVAPKTARLTFIALADPYGGVGCMVALVEAHGFRVTGIDDGTGFEAM